MGGKKRSTESVEVDEGVTVDTQGNEAVLSDKEPKKKMKKEKSKKEKPSASEEATSSELPMERLKKRKKMDKNRRFKASVKDESTKAKETKVQEHEHELKVEAPESGSSSRSSFPEFHIGVFKDLSSSDSALRESAAEAMVTELQEVQKAYEKLEDKSSVESGLNLEAQKDDGLNDCAPSLRYALRRLIRGVSSSRECARQGFALGLTLLVATIPCVKMDSLLKLIVDLMEITSSTKGQDAKECYLGRLFAYGAIARSGRLVDEWVSDRSTPFIKEFISVIVALAAKKQYLQQAAVSILLDLVEKMPLEALTSHVLEAPGLTKWFSEATEVGNPDALLLAMKIREKASMETPVFGNLLPNPFCVNTLFSAEHLSTLATCFKESTFCQPHVHGIWPFLVNILLPESLLQTEDAMSVSSSSKKHKKNRKSSSSEEEIAKNLQCFIEVVIEGSLLPSSHDRKHLGLNILQLLLAKLPASLIPVVLSYKIVQCLVDIMSSPKSWLFKVGQHFLSVVSDWVKDDDAKKVAVIVALQKHSNGKFDSLSRTKTVKDFMTDFGTESGCILFVQSLQDMFVDESHASEEPSDQSQTTDDNSEMGSNEDKDPSGALENPDFLKTWIVESLPSILKCSKLEPDSKFRIQKEILKFLAIQGVFTASLGTEVTSFELQEKFRWPKAATSTSLCKICIEQLQLLLSNSQKVEGSRGSSSSVEPNDLGAYFMRFLSTLRNIPSISVFRPLKEDEENVIKKLQATETTLSKEEKNSASSSDANRLHALRYLLIHLVLQILLHPDEFAEAASELIICCKKAYPAPELLESSGEDETDEAAPAVMDVLLDTLLSLLPHSSPPMRTSIEQVFKFFCDDVTVDGLVRMLRIVKKNLKPARHQVAESDKDDDEEEEDDDEDLINIEEDEVIDLAEAGEREEHTDDSEAVVEAEESDDDEKEASEDSDESDGGMDDDAMFRMDTYLTQIFKERKNQAGSETAQFQLVQFKLRVLSLLEIYLHENPGKPQVLLVYSNLAQTLVNPQTAESSEQLWQRILGIVQKKILKAKECPKGEEIQLSSLESLLQKSLKLATKQIKKKKLSVKKQSASLNRQKIISSFAQNSTFWILKLIDARNFPEPELQRVAEIFKGVLVGYFDSKKSKVKPEFLKDIFRRRTWIGRSLFGFLLEKCSAAKSEFRRIEALDLVTEIMKMIGPAEGSGLQELMKSNLSKFSSLIEVLVANKPDKQSRRADVRKFCVKIFQTVTTLNLAKPFLKSLDQNSHALCESQFGDQFSSLSKL